MRFEIRNFKNQLGREGKGFSCRLWIDGVRAADVIDDASGGPLIWLWIDREAEKKFDAHVQAQPDEPFGAGMEGTFRPDRDYVMVSLVAQYEIRKTYLRQCKTKTLFRLQDQLRNEYYISNTPFTPAYADSLRLKHGEQLVEIINETLENY